MWIAWLLAVRDAFPCSLALPGTFPVDVKVDDDVPPSGIDGDVGFEIYRGRGLQWSEKTDSCFSTSCDDLGLIEIRFPAATDDLAPPEEETHEFYQQVGVGYSLRSAGGVLPDGLSIPSAPSSAFLHEGTATLFLMWNDEETFDQDAFDFDLGITPVDSAGNLGPESIVTIAHDGSPDVTPCPSELSPDGPRGDGDEAECASIPARSGSTLAWLAIAIVALRRRSRSQPSSFVRRAPGGCSSSD